jgi:GNAT superfamily N-acetyltransferase
VSEPEERKSRERPKWSWLELSFGGDSSAGELGSSLWTWIVAPMTKHPPNQLSVRRATSAETDAAWAIVEEYYAAAGVVARDTKVDFVRIYFGDGAGVWLATTANAVVGCVALRPLAKFANTAEVKRLYVQPEHRGRGIAAGLYQSLEEYARERGYEWLYLDTTDDMVAARRFYAALGYELTARYNDNPQATIFMRKDLRSST